MIRWKTLWKSGPPVVRALSAQGITFVLLLVFARLWPVRHPLPFWLWPTAQGGLSALLAHRWGLGRWWQAFQVFLPFALVWQLGHSVPPWVYPALLVGLALVYGGGLLTRVPLYNSSRAAWAALLDLVPDEEGVSMADLGAGLGGPLSHLARHRPRGRFTGVEASPIVWLVAWVRTLPVRARCRVQFGSLWNLPLGEFQVVYAFLSPAPMLELWAKVRREMAPGGLLISNTFEIPGVQPERQIQLPGRRDACLLVYRI